MLPEGDVSMAVPSRKTAAGRTCEGMGPPADGCAQAGSVIPALRDGTDAVGPGCWLAGGLTVTSFKTLLSGSASVDSSGTTSDGVAGTFMGALTSDVSTVTDG